MESWSEPSLVDKLRLLVRRIRGDLVNYDVALYRDRLEAVNALESSLGRLSDQQLKQRIAGIKSLVREGSSLDDVLIDVYALVREAAARTIGLRPFDVQIIGGMALLENKVIEMMTGEGKTLVAVAPAVLRGLHGKGVHILTFNDYLARRDAEWMQPVYEILGLTVAFIEQDMGKEARRKAYQADVTYLTAKEAGFDFLRDGLAYEASELAQRPFHAAIVDEADSILIDEARVPLVIAGVTTGDVNPLQRRLTVMRSVVEKLRPGHDFALDENQRNVFLTEHGAYRVERFLECDNIFRKENLYLLTEINLALHAEALLKRDVDYIVRGGHIEIVDDFTGRVIEDRKWPFGLQAAIEAKEGLTATKDARVLGSITLQHFLRQYPHLSGMTATASSAAEELCRFYDLEVLVVPPNRPCIRVDHRDRLFTRREAKVQALVEEIARVHVTGRPILVGTLTVKESETLARVLERSGMACRVLNAKHDAEEAAIVADAGALGAVTIATNMAGRGTDIRLGGRDGREHERVAALGGLYVIGTNRHESRRIDDQLRGRAGRQGDPGSSCIFVSLEDDLLVRFGIEKLLARRRLPESQEHPLDDPVMQDVVERTQRIIEGQNQQARRTLWRYAHFIDKQRQIFSAMRRRILFGEEPFLALREEAAEARERAQQNWGEEVATDLERRLWLQAVDEAWSDHLETITEIRDGIHLAEIGGLSPLTEFQKQALTSFDHALKSVAERTIEKYAAIDLSANEPDLMGLGLHGPSSTWTYLVDDHAIVSPLFRALRRMGLG